MIRPGGVIGMPTTGPYPPQKDQGRIPFPHTQEQVKLLLLVSEFC